MKGKQRIKLRLTITQHYIKTESISDLVERYIYLLQKTNEECERTYPFIGFTFRERSSSIQRNELKCSYISSFKKHWIN